MIAYQRINIAILAFLEFLKDEGGRFHRQYRTGCVAAFLHPVTMSQDNRASLRNILILRHEHGQTVVLAN